MQQSGSGVKNSIHFLHRETDFCFRYDTDTFKGQYRRYRYQYDTSKLWNHEIIKLLRVKWVMVPT